MWASPLAALFHVSDVLQWPPGSSAGILRAGNISIIPSSLSSCIREAERTASHVLVPPWTSLVFCQSLMPFFFVQSFPKSLLSLLTLFCQLAKRFCGKCSRGQVLLNSAPVTGTYCLSGKRMFPEVKGTPLMVVEVRQAFSHRLASAMRSSWDCRQVTLWILFFTVGRAEEDVILANSLLCQVVGKLLR